MRTLTVKTPIRLCLIALLPLATTGCIYVGGEHVDSGWRAEQRENREAISRLEIGSPRSAVLSELGSPHFSEAFDRDGEEIRILFYRTQRRHSDGRTTRDETTPLIFENELLVGWGDSVYEDVRR